ncbi:hypothetical protein AB1O90_04220 [Pediococcus pentosaceus]|jgi:hypothetical protein|uniref:hypothetical protein n=1 Tax=Pediococcus pentosaceus TaxID=1255 RepID=UPI00223B9C55|nr:hypothetical protein [Pediococcus pentosaceus]MCS8562741.1 hypothetical protein [Pediococcus pentosaceus]MCS8566956.1 hypothetical protein [Pediococcus pentosaceus]MCS8579819.1 hypothetical protein [Pediococcus pentosaceus]
MTAKDAITVINVVFPKGSDDLITISYNLNTEHTNQHGTVRLTGEEFRNIKNGVEGYPNAVLAKINEENTTITEDVHDEI